ncbi:hypothetical protein L1987_14410 [Smallanthus sonchifolius]|uniref:Uncharacterized protein n=1 Tax=Smallanthus sonchifolius TaxID=185202 RepID=A0ACB9J4W6_9ASTR|nr:hypothetical protein L1987_14410 [Smallanthus sonchifolius]
MKLRSVEYDRGLTGCPAGTSAIHALAHLASYDDDTIDDYDYEDDTSYSVEFGIEVASISQMLKSQLLQPIILFFFFFSICKSPIANCCVCCNLPISSSDHIYACPPSKFPELITHPSHRQHPLSLYPTSIYPGGFFRCDACAQRGTRFSYHCQFCDFDLHVLCASKPLSINHPHPLVLTFSSPYGEKSGFSCDVCRTVGSADQWLYRCVCCEFDVHLHCATAKMLQPPISHSMSTGHAQIHWQTQNSAPVGVQRYQQPQAPLGLQQSYQASVGFQGPPQPQP